MSARHAESRGGRDRGQASGPADEREQTALRKGAASDARRLAHAAVTVLAAMLVAVTMAGCASSADSAAGGTASSSSAVPSAAAGPAQPTRDDVKAFVDKAVAYAGANGKKAALAAFTAPGGEFHDGSLYIYAYDFDGKVIAHGGDPKLVGENLLDMHDPNGVPVIQELVKLAKSGDGWLYYTWPNPVNDDKEEPKLGYVVKVDDTWFLGSGTYGPAAVKQ
jgi:hypothetical protein